MISANTYSEVFEILSLMDKKVVMKVPEKILNNIKLRRNTNYKLNLTTDNIFNPNIVSKEALEIIACLDVNYWMDKEKSLELRKKYYDNINNDSINSIFKNNRNTKNELSINVYKENRFKSIINKLKAFFKIK